MTSPSVPPLANIRKKRTSQRRPFGGSRINVVHGALTSSNSGSDEQNRATELRQPAGVTPTRVYGGSIPTTTTSVDRWAREAPQASEIYTATPSHIEGAEFTSRMIPRVLEIGPRQTMSIGSHGEPESGSGEVRMAGPEGTIAQIGLKGIQAGGHQDAESSIFEINTGGVRAIWREGLGPQVDPEQILPFWSGVERTRAISRREAPYHISVSPEWTTSVVHEMAHQLIGIGFEGVQGVDREDVTQVLRVDPEGIILTGHRDAPQPLWNSFDSAREPLRNRASLLILLRRLGQPHIADRIQRYFDARDQEPDEPPIIIESLSSLVNFIVQESHLLTPIIGSDPEGHMEIEWHLQDNGDPSSVWGRGNGVVSLRFLKSGDVHYVALSGPFRRGQERLKIHGKSTRDDIIANLREFAERVTNS